MNNARFWIDTWLRISLVVCLANSYLASTAYSTPNSSQVTTTGVDLSQWDGDTPLDLDGPWEFHWKTLLEGGSESHAPDLRFDKIRIWTDGKLESGEVLPSEGYGSYRLTLRGLKARPSGYLLSLVGIRSAAKIIAYSKDQEETKVEAQVGHVTAADVQASSRSLFLQIYPQTGAELQIIIQVANQDVSGGGIWMPPVIGPSAKVRQPLVLGGLANAASMGVSLAIGIYSTLIHLRRRRDHVSLSLACLSFTICLRAFSTTAFVADLIPETAFHWLRRLEYLTMPGTYISGIYFVRKAFFPEEYRRLSIGLALSGMALVLLTLVVPVIVFSKILLVYQIHVLMTSCGIFWIMAQAWKTKKEGVKLVLIGIIIAVSASFFDIVFVSILSKVKFFIGPFGTAVFLLIQSQYVAKKSAAAYRQAEVFAKDIAKLNENLKKEVDRGIELNANLEKKVLERTTEIRSLLEHIPQGILTIGERGLIGANFSAHLPQIIQQTDIANRSFKEVILDHTLLSQNLIDQAWQTILACIGEDVLNFEVNSKNLPTQFEYVGRHEVIFKCTWNVELDSLNVIKKILVTLMDITAESEASKKLEAKNQEFLIIQQLIEIGNNKSKQFFSSCRELLSENARLISGDNINSEDIKILFVNMHTIKGSARTLQLTEMSNVVHVVESYFVDILRHDAAIDKERLVKDQFQAEHAFQKYETINHNILGRTNDESKVVLEREFIEKHCQILKFIHLEQSDLSNLKISLREHYNELVAFIFMSLPSIFEDISLQAQRIAKDLDKYVPIFSIDTDEILISHKQELAIRNAFIHLLRNSLDHGIEDPQLRMANGKDPHGQITLKGEQLNGKISIRYADDGAGLALGRLREKGLKNQLIDPTASRQEIADLVFHQGMSTSNSISMISGRGIGMNAVKRFIEAEGGTVDLCLDDMINPAGEYYRFHLIIQLPSNSEGHENMHALVS